MPYGKILCPLFADHDSLTDWMDNVIAIPKCWYYNFKAVIKFCKRETDRQTDRQTERERERERERARDRDRDRERCNSKKLDCTF